MDPPASAAGLHIESEKGERCSLCSIHPTPKVIDVEHAVIVAAVVWFVLGLLAGFVLCAGLRKGGTAMAARALGRAKAALEELKAMQADVAPQTARIKVLRDDLLRREAKFLASVALLQEVTRDVVSCRKQNQHHHEILCQAVDAFHKHVEQGGAPAAFVIPDLLYDNLAKWNEEDEQNDKA